jgi:HAD superfamily hydrolase (TIGR01549 family)
MSLKNIKVIIYDCDGVLVDSKRAVEAFYNHILERFGMPPLAPNQLQLVHSWTQERAVDYLFKSSPWTEEAQKYRKAIDYKPFISNMCLEKNVREVLFLLRPTYRTAIATNRSNTLPQVLRYYSMEALFDMVVTSLDVNESKPNPECVWKILKHFNLFPDEALYIGDSEVDRLMCESAGMTFMAYKNDTLEAQHHLEDHMDLLHILNLTSETKGN